MDISKISVKLLFANIDFRVFHASDLSENRIFYLERISKFVKGHLVINS